MRLHTRALQRVAAAYALGSLSTRARRRFETLLGRDPLARRAWQQCEERLSGLAQDMPPVRPPDSSWPAIAWQLKQKPRQRRAPRGWLLIAALLVLGAAIVLWRKA